MSASRPGGARPRPSGGLPTLQELLRCADEGLLFRVILKDHAPGLAAEARGSSKRRRSIERRLARTLEAMRSLPSPERRRKERLLLLEETFVLQGSSCLIERRVGARLVFPKDLARARGLLEGGLRPGASASADPPMARAWPALRGFALDPWEETLASRAGLDGARCRQERYQVLAAAFWEMTYYGFEYERAVANQMRAKARELTGDASLGPRGAEDSRSLGKGPSQSTCDGGAAGPLRRAERKNLPFDLIEPDRFEEDYCSGLVARVAELNDGAQAAFWRRAIECARLSGAG